MDEVADSHLALVRQLLKQMGGFNHIAINRAVMGEIIRHPLSPS